MADPETLTIDVNGFATRVWRKGRGPKLGFLAGYGGLPRWVPFLDRAGGKPHGHRPFPARASPAAIAAIPCSTRTSIGCLRSATCCARPIWPVPTWRVVRSAASMVAEMAAIWPESVRRIALIAPFGLFDEKNPPTDPWAQRPDAIPSLMCADPEIWKALKAAPDSANSIEWPIEQNRANEAAARIFWPLGNTKLEKRLPLIAAPTLLIWGAEDRIMPRNYASVIQERIAGPSEVTVIQGAGHLAELDQPHAVADAILRWTG